MSRTRLLITAVVVENRPVREVATAAGSTPSASAEPTPEPASSSWSKTATSRVIDAATGELIRELVLDPTKRYQATGRPPGPTR